MDVHNPAEQIVEAPAHEALRIWFEAEKSRTYAGMGRVLNLSPATIASWCRTDTPVRPSNIATLFAVHVLTGIPVHAWLDPEETEWLRNMSNGQFLTLFERPKRPIPSDPRQMDFDGFWRPNAPQPTPITEPGDVDSWM
jgi:hypothetical protein